MSEVVKAKLEFIRKRALVSIRVNDESDAQNYLKHLRANNIISDDDYSNLKRDIDNHVGSSKGFGFSG